MTRLAISVEGQTEEEFVNELLAVHLREREVYAEPILLGRARRRVQGGGNVTVDRLAKEMRHLRGSFDAVTSLVDFYGFRGKRTMSPDDLTQAIRRSARRTRRLSDQSVFPYVLIQGYRKTLHGPLLAERIGLDRIRAECPRFDAWLRRLESLGTSSHSSAPVA